MSHTNSTPNYNLPQFLTTDKPFWLTDINGAFSAIDTGLDAAKDAADAAQSDATQALSDASSAGTAAATADGKGSGAVASIAPAFDPTSTYAEGSLVMYNSLLYRCETAVTVPGPWSGTANWQRTDMFAMLKQFNGVINSKSEILENRDNGPYAVNDTLQIPATMLSKKLITICARRYGYAESVTFPTAVIAGGAVATNCQLRAADNIKWDLSISSTGLITVKYVGDANPFIDLAAWGA